MTKDEILAALADLSPDELQAIKAVTDTLIGPMGRPDSLGAGQTPATWLAEAMGLVLGSTAPLSGAAARSFNKNINAAVEFFQQNFAEALNNKVTALALMRYLLKLLVVDLQSMGVPVTKTTLAQNLHRVGEVFNNAFPGYAEGQVSTLILSAILGGKT